MLSVSLQHSFDEFELDVQFQVPYGVTVLFGQSGSGKTTVANAVAGLLKPQKAKIAIDETVLVDTESKQFIPVHKRQVGYVFQESRLFPHLSVRDNLNFGADAKVSLESSDLIELLGIGHLLDRMPHGLSGGERQRVAIGRALLSDPKVLIADEPLAALDDERKGEILPYFEKLRDELSLPILYVSHAVTEVARLATSVVVLDHGKVIRQGEALEVFGDPSVVPTDVRSVGAVLECLVVGYADDALCTVQLGEQKLFVPRVEHNLGEVIRLRIPAHEVILATEEPKNLSALNILSGTIEALRSIAGSGVIVSLNTGAGSVLARVTQRSVERLGLTIGLHCYAIIKSVAIAPEDVGS